MSKEHVFIYVGFTGSQDDVDRFQGGSHQARLRNKRIWFGFFKDFGVWLMVRIWPEASQNIEPEQPATSLFEPMSS